MSTAAIQLIIFVAVGVWLYRKARRRFSRSTGRRVVVHSHGTNLQQAARHEAGHAVVARRLGGRDVHGRAYVDGSGWVSSVFVSGDDVTDRINSAVTSLAGLATGDHPRHCRIDIANAKATLRGTGVSYGQALRQSRKIVGRRSGEVRSAARRAERTGRL